jgi:hypothetical protein
MKFLLFTVVSLIPALSFATSATLGITKKIRISIENQSNVNIESIRLSASFSCNTTTKDYWSGESETRHEEASLDIETDAKSISGNMFLADIQNMRPSFIKAPAKQTFFDSQRCNVYVFLTTNIIGRSEPVVFPSPLGEATSEKTNADLTSRFEKDVEGDYVIKFVYSGTTPDIRTGEMVKYCQLALFKKENGSLITRGSSYYGIEKCNL